MVPSLPEGPLSQSINWTENRPAGQHHVPDGAVFSRRIHRLKNNKDSVAIRRVVKLLQRAQLLNVCFQEFLILLLRFEK
jgi:hypothetical protein